jgi:hypothetical protein
MHAHCQSTKFSDYVPSCDFIKLAIEAVSNRTEIVQGFALKTQYFP